MDKKMKRFTIHCTVEISAEDDQAALQVVDRLLLNNSIRDYPDPWLEALLENAVIKPTHD